MSDKKSIEAAQAKLERMRERGETPERENNPVTRCFKADKPSWRLSINAMCAYCMGCTSAAQGPGHQEHIERGFRHMIRDCASVTCPLHHFRPYQNAK